MDYLTPEEIAIRLRVTPKTVRRWCQLGELKAAKAGPQWRIAPAALEEYLNRSREVKDDSKKADGLTAFATRPTIAAAL